jgi:uncharacterized SAM-binding protein YcdF (DUF218 family)
VPAKWYERKNDAWVQPRGAPRRIPWLLIILIFLALLALLHPWWLPLVPRLLVVDQPPAQADAIMVLGGGSGSREDRALALYRQGLAPDLITSGEPPKLPGFHTPFAELSAEYLAAQGAPAQAIFLLPETTSTRDEALAALDLARQRGYHTLIVVTDHFHSRRAYWTFRKAFRGSGIRLIMVAAYPDWFPMDRWWQEERSLLAVAEECEKLLLYLFRGYLF